MIEDLKDKVVLITGSSTGIGAAAARAFGEHGARVAVHYNKSRDEAEKVAAGIEKAGGKAFVVAGDVTGSAVCRELVHKTVARFGRLDVLINNAGGLVQRMPVEAGFFIVLVTNITFPLLVFAVEISVRSAPFAWNWKYAALFALGGIVGTFLGRRFLFDTVKILGPSRASVFHSTAPAFALWVWMICGLSLHITRSSFQRTSASRGPISRLISLMISGSTPAPRAK